VDENEIGISNSLDEITSGYNSEPETYENLPKSLSSSTTVHERDQGTIS
jgi:hypothetical protein